MDASHFTFDAIGTTWDVNCLFPRGNADEVYAKIRARIDLFDVTYSRFRSDSLVQKMAKEAGVYEMPSDFAPLWSVYESLYRLSGGAFTPLVGSLLEDFGYDANYSLTKKDSIRPVPPLHTAVSYTPPTLTILKPALLDIGAGGKGHLVDIVGAILKNGGAESFTINAGGDILQYGATTLKVGLENPNNTMETLGIVHIQSESICGSAGNRRRLGSEHHIVDPKTGVSPKNINAVWVIAQSALLADALATALYFTDPEILLAEYSFDYAILFSDQSVRYSSRFSESFFS